VSGEGAPPAEPVIGAAGLRVAIIAARWHSTVMGGLLAGARRALADSNVTEVTEVRVPGCFELPVAAAARGGAAVDQALAEGRRAGSRSRHRRQMSNTSSGSCGSAGRPAGSLPRRTSSAWADSSGGHTSSRASNQ